MKYMIAAIVLANFSSFGVCKDMRIPTCEEAAQAIMDDIEKNGSGDCAYLYENAKPISVDKENGTITCQAIAERHCFDMPEENYKRNEKYTARYGIVVDFLEDTH